MSEAEKQEGQKTVVAFITGLLIGGLLVWVFSSTPEAQPTETSETETNTEEPATTEGPTNEVVVTTERGSDTPKKLEPVQGDGTLKVADQVAGDAVTLGEISYPADAGWIVVRDYADGAPGNILGAARYNLEGGLTPSSVTLLRKTEKGKSYQVAFYADNGDMKFSTADDAPVTGGEVVFKAN